METALEIKSLPEGETALKNKMNSKAERNHGIDLLKVLAMFMVVVLHVLGQGGVLGATAFLDPSHCMAWLLEIASFGAVNCFAIATGFLMVGRKIKYRRLVSMWLTVQFYNLLFFLLFHLQKIPKLTLTDVSNFFPVYSGQFWYFTAYFGLFLFIPFLNLLLEKMCKKQLFALLLTGFILFSVLFSFLGGEPFGMSGGYSIWWLMYLYFVGAAIAKFRFLRKTPPHLAFLGYMLCVAVTFGIRMLISYLSINDFGELGKIIIANASPHINYNAPLMTFGAIFFVIFCLNLRIPKIIGKVLAWMQPFVFQVYIIHLHPVIWKGVILHRFTEYAKASWYILPLLVLGMALCIFVCCFLVDVVRHYLFKLLGIDRLINFTADKSKAIYNRSKCKDMLDSFFVF